MSSSHHRLLRISRCLEASTIALALLAVGFRATFYARLPPLADAKYGRGDLIDFALGALLFLVAFATATSGALLAHRVPEQLGLAYRPLVIGVTTFTIYFFVHPYIPT
jgi:hypothetical protein